MAGSASPKRMLMGIWDRITHNFTVAKAIWRDAYPEPGPKSRGILELTAMLVVRAASLSNLFDGHIDTYVVACSLVISAGLICNQPPAGAFAWVARRVRGYRSGTIKQVPGSPASSQQTGSLQRAGGSLQPSPTRRIVVREDAW